MKQNKLNEIVSLHCAWLNNTGGEQADLRDANLRWADLRNANLRDADLRWADLRDANLDFSSLPLWCGSFEMIIDDRLLFQLVHHMHKFNIKFCSPEAQKILNATDKWKNEFCKYRNDLEPIK